MPLEKLEFWIDLNLPPKMATWLIEDFNVKAKSFFELGYSVTSDVVIFKDAAQKDTTIVITTKDIDFKNLQNDIGAPPKILYFNVGNISNQQLKKLVDKHFNEVLNLFTQTSNTFVEISL